MERGLLANFKDIVINENDKFIYSFIIKKNVFLFIFILCYFYSLSLVVALQLIKTK